MNKALLAIYMLAMSAAAYDNSTATESYKALMNGQQINATWMPYVAALGEWFWVILIFAPYVAMTLNHRTVNIATIWLLCMTIAYGALIEGLGFTSVVSYMIVGVWMTDILRRLLSPVFSN